MLNKFRIELYKSLYSKEMISIDDIPSIYRDAVLEEGVFKRTDGEFAHRVEA